MSTLSRADSSQIAEERILEEQLKGRSSKKTKKKKKSILLPSHAVSVKVQAVPLVLCLMLIPSAVRPLSKEITMSQAYQNMCAGMYKVGR